MYVVERLGLLVRVHADFHKSVVFIGVDSPGGFFPVGTGFACYTPIEGREEYLFAVCTAAHVIDDLSDESRALVAVRLNTIDGQSKTVRVDATHRFDHPNPANDLAVLLPIVDQIGLSTKGFRIEAATIARAREQCGPITPGDDVVAIGLFTSLYGKINNIPIQRSGNIAAVPNEPVRTARGYAEALLIELRTFAGLSGSPVIQVMGPVRIHDGVPQFQANNESGGHLIGMLVGHHTFDGRIDKIDTQRHDYHQDGISDDGHFPDELNTGVGVVIPVERILEVFQTDKWKSNQRRALEDLDSANRYREASFGTLKVNS